MIRCIYRDTAPDFPASDQHPDAVRYGPRVVDGKSLFVDAIGDEPTDDDIRAVLNPPVEPAESPDVAKLVADKLGCSLLDLRAALNAAERP